MEPRLSASTLQVASHLSQKLTSAWSKPFVSQGIVLTPGSTAACDQSAAAIVESLALPESDLVALVAAYKSAAVPVIYAIPRDHPNALALCEAGADALVAADAEGTEAAWCVRSVVLQSQLRCAAEERVRELERELARGKLLAHATAIIAKKLQISEIDALSHLRTESRRRRQPMEQLATVIIEAERVVSTGLNKPNGGK